VKTTTFKTALAFREWRDLPATGMRAMLSLADAATGGAVAQLVGIVPALTLASVLIAVAGVIVLRTSGGATHEEHDHPAQRSHHGQDEKPLDHCDRENDPEDYECCQQEK
jgi:hypothetical protein